MAVVATKIKSAVQINYLTGTDGKGVDIIKGQKFSNVKIDALDQAIFDTATALAPMISYPMTGIQKTDIFELV